MVRKFLVSFFAMAVIFSFSLSHGTKTLEESGENRVAQKKARNVTRLDTTEELSSVGSMGIPFVEECLTYGLEGEDVFKITEAVRSLYPFKPGDLDAIILKKVIKQREVVACAYALIIRDDKMDVDTRLGILRSFHALPNEAVRSDVAQKMLTLFPDKMPGIQTGRIIRAFGAIPDREIRTTVLNEANMLSKQLGWIRKDGQGTTQLFPYPEGFERLIQALADFSNQENKKDSIKKAKVLYELVGGRLCYACILWAFPSDSKWKQRVMAEARQAIDACDGGDADKAKALFKALYPPEAPSVEKWLLSESQILPAVAM